MTELLIKMVTVVKGFLEIHLKFYKELNQINKANSLMCFKVSIKWYELM